MTREEELEKMQASLLRMGTRMGTGPITRSNARSVYPTLGNSVKDKAMDWILAKTYIKELGWA